MLTNEHEFQSNVTLVHIAGTNGKGSVAFKIAQTLQLAGHNVGLLTSPHLASFRERIQVNGRIISELEVAQYLPQLYYICESRGISATFFELTTALAFQFFAARSVNVVVLETGLGGRLDATNVVNHPALCVITSIGLEHTHILGNTIEQIAREKAGIIKKDTPVLVGPHVPNDVIRQYASEKGAGRYYTCRDIIGEFGKPDVIIDAEKWIHEDIRVVDYDVENSCLATAAIYLLRKYDRIGKFASVTKEHVIEGTSRRPPCRFEIIQINNLLPSLDDVLDIDCLLVPQHGGDDGNINGNGAVTVVLDVAHNPPAMRLLVAKLQKTYPSTDKRIIAGFSSDKDLRECGRCLLSIVDNPTNIHLVQAPHPRAATIEAILHAEPKLSKSKFDMNDRGVSTQLRVAFDLARKNDEILVVCGSVFIMAEAREVLGFDEPKDSRNIVEVIV